LIDRTAYIRAVVLHRCPEIGPADLALMAAEPNDTLPRQIAEQILTVLDSMVDRLDELTAIVRDHDDAADRRSVRRARQAGA
jgi:hypothetical protein